MSQEINLLNPALRKKRDWLSFDVVAASTLVALLAIGGLYAYAGLQASGAQRMSADLTAQVAAVQEELQQTKSILTARKNDPAVEQEFQRLTHVVRLRKEVLRLAEGSADDGSGGVADVMRGFSRQIVEGVWLTGFSVGPGSFEIRGRLLEPSLLPVYIRRLNGEPAFRGRRFAALDMRVASDEPLLTGNAPAQAGTASPPPTPAGPKFTEFVLRPSAALIAPVGERR